MRAARARWRRPSGDSGAKDRAFDPCSVLTTQDIAAITTDAVSGAERQEQTCVYHSKPSDGVQVTIYPTDAERQMAAVHNAGRLLGGMGAAVAGKGGAGADVANILKPDARPVPKIGDEAVWEPNATLAVRKGDAFVEVSPPIMHDPANHPGYPLVKDEEKRAIAQRIAEQVLAKLGR